MAEVEKNKVSNLQAIKMVFTDRQMLAMFLLGLASGFPYVAVGGMLNAWLTTVDVKPSTIGLLSWALLAYSFKFLWAAALQTRRTPFNFPIGSRRFFMIICLVLIVLGLLALTFSEPPNNLGRIGIISILIAVFSASFDIVQAAWRIESARDDRHLDILSAVEQIGYRTASLLGGFVALLLADKIGWKDTFLWGTALMALTSIGIFLAKDSPIAKNSTELKEPYSEFLTPVQKNIATLLVLAGWLLGFSLLANFMYGALTDPASHSARSFIREQGPWVVSSTVIWLGLIAAGLVYLNRQGLRTGSEKFGRTGGVVGILYSAILVPMMDIVGRLKWASILVILLILSYRFTDLIWGGFAYPFYLGTNYGALGHTLTEVGVASKLIGVIATILGIGIGGFAMLIFGRMPVLFVGAILAAVTNLLFADLANGAVFTDKFLDVVALDSLFAWLDGLFPEVNIDQRMARLITVIFAENVAVGLASAASVAYLSSIVNKNYAAVQYALLVSLVMLLGVLGRPAIGQIIEEQGFERAFIICAWLGGVAVILSLIEWIRVSRQPALEG